MESRSQATTTTLNIKSSYLVIHFVSWLILPFFLTPNLDCSFSYICKTLKFNLKIQRPFLIQHSINIFILDLCKVNLLKPSDLKSASFLLYFLHARMIAQLKPIIYQIYKKKKYSLLLYIFKSINHD